MTELPYDTDMNTTSDRHIIAKFTDDEYRRLKSLLALRGVSLAQWVRETALRVLKQSSVSPKHGHDD